MRYATKIDFDQFRQIPDVMVIDHPIYLDVVRLPTNDACSNYLLSDGFKMLYQ